MGITQIDWNTDLKRYIEGQFILGKNYNDVADDLKLDRSSFRKKIVSLGWEKERLKYINKQRELRREEKFEKKLRRYPSAVLPHTRKYLVENLRKNPKFRTNKGIILKEDFIEQYYKSREGSERVFNYDFSQVPDIIPSRKALVPVFVNEISTKTGKLVGEWKTCYKSLITLLEDNRICAGMVSKTKTSQYIDTEEFIRRSKSKFGDNRFDYDETVYVNNHTPVKLRCLRCGTLFTQMPSEHLNGTGYCPTCAMQVCGIDKRKTSEEFIAELVNIFGDDIFDFSETVYIDSQHPVTITDRQSKIKYTRYPSYLLEGNDPRCKDSKGEMYIREWLIENGIAFDSEVLQRDVFLENRFGVYIDFITQSNIWIEYNGIQHYKFYNGAFHGISIDDFKKQLRRDAAIASYCNKNNIKLVVIPYTYDTKDKISNILKRVILGNDDISFIKYPKIENI